MDKFKSYITSIIAIIIAVGIFLPSVSSLVHSFEDHHHFSQCDNPLEVHVHENILDCDFQLIVFDNADYLIFSKSYAKFKCQTTFVATPYTAVVYDQKLSLELGRAPPIA